MLIEHGFSSVLKRKDILYNIKNDCRATSLNGNINTHKIINIFSRIYSK